MNIMVTLTEEEAMALEENVRVGRGRHMLRRLTMGPRQVGTLPDNPTAEEIVNFVVNQLKENRRPE